MDKPIRIILDAMVFGDLSSHNEEDQENKLINKIMSKKNAVVINKEIENNYEGYFKHRGISERIALMIKREMLKKLENNNILVKINFNDEQLSIKVPSDDHFYFKTAVKISKQGKFYPIMITEDLNWFKLSTKMKKIYNVSILNSTDFLNQ